MCVLACVCWLITNVSCAVRTLWYSWCRWGFCPSWWTSSSTSPWLVCCRAERWEWGLWYAQFVLPLAVDIVHMTLAGGEVGGGLWCFHGVSYHCGGHCCPQHLGWSFGKKRGWWWCGHGVSYHCGGHCFYTTPMAGWSLCKVEKWGWGLWYARAVSPVGWTLLSNHCSWSLENREVKMEVTGCTSCFAWGGHCGPHYCSWSLENREVKMEVISCTSCFAWGGHCGPHYCSWSLAGQRAENGGCGMQELFCLVGVDVVVHTALTGFLEEGAVRMGMIDTIAVHWCHSQKKSQLLTLKNKTERPKLTVACRCRRFVCARVCVQPFYHYFMTLNSCTTRSPPLCCEPWATSAVGLMTTASWPVKTPALCLHCWSCWRVLCHTWSKRQSGSFPTWLVNCLGFRVYVCRCATCS